MTIYYLLCYNLIKSNSQGFTEENCLKLYQLMTKKNYLEELTTTLSELCQNPVLTMDYRHMVHSYQGYGTENSVTWNEMITYGHLNPARIKNFFHETMQTLIRSRKPLQIHYEEETILLTPVISEETFMGLIAVLELSHPLTYEEIEYTTIMADILALHCERPTIYDKDNEYKHHHILLDLLQNNISSDAELKKRMHERNWKPSDYYRVLLANLSEQHRSYQETIRDYCSYYSLHSRVMIYDNKLLILEESNQPIHKKSIETCLLPFHLQVAISDTFSELYQLPIYYKQALHTLLFCKEDSNPDKTYYYEDYRLEDFFLHCIPIYYPKKV